MAASRLRPRPRPVTYFVDEHERDQLRLLALLLGDGDASALSTRIVRAWLAGPGRQRIEDAAAGQQFPLPAA
jgi:hypothetical protein